MADGPLFHLVAGGTGAGKSTYAARLASEMGALRFSIDPWMMQLYWPDSPPGLDFDWAMERVRRCHGQMLETGAQAAALGVPCVFDLGASERKDRDAFVAAAAERGRSVKLHWFDVAAKTRWARVQKRNEEQGDTFAFPVTRMMFQFMEERLQAPDAAELAALSGVVVT